jgi:hypothetical protein
LRSFLKTEHTLAAPRVWAHAATTLSAVPGTVVQQTAHTLAGDAGLAHRSSVNHRIAIDRQCHLHDRPTLDHPAVQFISRRTQPASLRSRCRLAESNHYQYIDFTKKDISHTVIINLHPRIAERHS